MTHRIKLSSFASPAAAVEAAIALRTLARWISEALETSS